MRDALPGSTHYLAQCSCAGLSSQLGDVMQAALDADITCIGSGIQVILLISEGEEIQLRVQRRDAVLDAISETQDSTCTRPQSPMMSIMSLTIDASCAECFMGVVDVSEGSFEDHCIEDGARLR